MQCININRRTGYFTVLVMDSWVCGLGLRPLNASFGLGVCCLGLGLYIISFGVEGCGLGFGTPSLRRIRQIRRFIDECSLRLLVHAFITSRLDYCNGLFANCSVAVPQRLQQIQNSAARLVMCRTCF